MRALSRPGWMIGVVAAVVALAGCGNGTEAGPETTDIPVTAPPTGTGDGSHGCIETVIVGASPDNADFVATETFAQPGEDGGYTLFLANFALDEDAILEGTAPSIPDAGTLFVVTASPPEAGSDGEIVAVAPGDEFGVATGTGEPGFHVELSGAESSPAVDPEGSLWVTETSDRFCGEIAYRDAEKSLAGTFEAATGSG